MSQNTVLLVKVPQAAAMLGISRTKLYELIARKEIPVCRIDRSVRISVDTLEKWVASQVGNSLADE
jgi:excisionase family DNA binding protein